MLSEKTFYAVVVAIVIIGGLGIGVAYDHAISTASPSGSHPTTNNSSGGSNYYSLTLVVTTNNQYNSSVGNQPAFYILSGGKLQSTANITLPSNKKIDLTIINYDDGVGPVATQYDNVTGTTNDQISIINNTNVNSTYNGQNISVIGGQKVSQVPNDNIAHTFTILSGATVVVNIPITPSSIIQTSFTLSSGSYSWQCEVACGSGSSGWEGAMNAPGWMAGTVYSSPAVSTPSSQPYSLTLVVTTNNFFNQSVGNQPAFYVLENGSLYSTTQLKLPSKVEISLTVIDFDDGVGPVVSQYAAVAGTTNNQISIVNNTNVNSTEGSNGINISGGSTVSQVPSSNIAHTLTILATGNKIVLNIPLTPSSVVSTTFSITSGNYTWQCEVPCGSGSSGWEGAMSTAGWMEGSVYVS